jgi:putative spermidine/putrescine transport system permease protein
MKLARNDRHVGLFVLPALALLSLLFVLPIVRFFVEAFRGHDLAQVAAQGRAVLGSAPVEAALLTTNAIALQVTVLVLLLAYPIALYLTRVSGMRFSFVMFCVVAPTLTGTIVRTFALMVMGGRYGLVNDVLVDRLGLLSLPLQLLYTRPAVVVAMAYVLLPYMVLTLYAAMKSVDSNLLRAARSLGASERQVFLRVFLPLSMHGVVSGSLMVFIFALGYYLTPALIGGQRDIMFAQLIQRTIEQALDWSSAAFMSLLLVVVTLLLYGIYCWVTDVRRLLGAHA